MTGFLGLAVLPRQTEFGCISEALAFELWSINLTKQLALKRLSVCFVLVPQKYCENGHCQIIMTCSERAF